MAEMSSIGIPVLPGFTITTSVASDTNPPAHDQVQHVSLVRRLWLRSGAVLDALGRCWFLIATFLVAAIFLVRFPQGLEALVAGIDPREYALGGLVYFTASMAAMQAALFASLLLEQPPIEDGEDVRARQYAAYYVPALIGLIAVSLIACEFEIYIKSTSIINPLRRLEVTYIWTYVMDMTAFLIAFIRKAWIPKTRNRGLGFVLCWICCVFSGYSFKYTRSSVASFLILALGYALIDGCTWSPGGPGSIRVRKRAGVLLAVLWLVWGFLLARYPIDSGQAFGPATVLLIGLSFWIAVAFLATILFRGWVGQGAAALLCFGLAYWFFSGPFSEQEVRTLTPSKGAAGVTARGVGQHAEQWLTTRREKILAAKTYPVFIVTAEGGGIRAAYWTAALLCGLQDENSHFADHVFGISGVSGGSLGAAVFAGLVKESRAGKLQPRDGGPKDAGLLRRASSAVLGCDFLSPPLAAMLISDVVRNIVRGRWSGERAAALEGAFEAAWRDNVGTDRFAERFEGLWGDQDCCYVPSLFLNCTRADTGQRLVMGNLAIEGGLESPGDLQAMLGQRSVRLSTAVLISARFPVISPTGILQDSRDNARVPIVDGGYFDNSGAVTAGDELDALLGAARKLQLEDHLNFVAIMIANDPIAREPTEPSRSRDDAKLDQPGFAGFLVSPLQTLDKIREGQTKRFEEEFKRRFKAIRGKVFDQFQPRQGDVDFPLGWMLTNHARDALDQQIGSWKNNRESHFHRVLELLPHDNLTE